MNVYEEKFASNCRVQSECKWTLVEIKTKFAPLQLFPLLELKVLLRQDCLG